MREDIKKRIEQKQKGILPDGYLFRYKYICPQDWDLYKLGKITKRVSIKNGDSKEYPVYSINNENGFIPQNEQFEQGSYNDLDKSSYKVVNRGQFAYNPARINVGSIGLLKDVEKAIISSLYVCFSMKEDEHCLDYFEQWFMTYDFYKEVIRNLEGSVREYLFYENLSNIHIALPKKKEQTKIASILIYCDKVIELKKQLIEEMRNRKKWMLQNLFNPSNGVRLAGFDGEWKSYSLSDVGRFFKGTGISNEDCLVGDFPCIKYGDIYMSYKELFTSPISHTEEKISAATPKVIEGDLLFTASGEDRLEIGKCTTYLGSDPLAVGGDIVVLRPDRSKYNSMFLAYQQYSEALIKQKARLAQGYSIVHLYTSQVRELKIMIPPTIEEQTAIANSFFAIDQNISLLEQELNQWQQKKKALMQLLLTGLVRVIA